MRPIYARGQALARRIRADFWASTPVEVVSPLPLDVSVARLQAATDREGWGALTGSRPVVGRVKNGAVRLRLRKRASYQNSFQTVLRGTLASGPGGGTVFRGRTGLPALVVGFVALWFGLLVVIGTPMVLIGLVSLLVGRLEMLMLLLAPLGMLVGGIAFVSFGRWMARNEEVLLREFVVAMLEGRRV